jgi:D-arabinose 1-dehydrogenase-like Zn-dependent alcohol dehydrogenase
MAFEQAAVAADSMVTAYYAITVQGEVDAGKTVAIIGRGGLGMMAVRFAVLEGAKMIGIDTGHSKFDLARPVGREGDGF